jgi:hypothetical protein
MSTKLDAAKLAAIGQRFRTPYLLQQAGYTLRLAMAEGPPLAALLPGGYLGLVTRLRDDVRRALEDRAVSAMEANQTVATEHEHMRAATIWARKVGKRCQSAMHLGIGVSPELTRLSDSLTVPGMLEQMGKTLALLAGQAAAMDTVLPATQPLLDDGRRLFRALQQSDSAQVRARATDLPGAVTDFLTKKGQLYSALKVINSAGQELCAHDLNSAARFNMSILHRQSTTTEASVMPAARATHPTPIDLYTTP